MLTPVIALFLIGIMVLWMSGVVWCGVVCIDGDAADGDQVSVSRRIRLLRRQDLLEGATSVPARRRRPQGQVRAVRGDLAAGRGRCGRRLAPLLGAAAPPGEAHATRADPRHGAGVRRAVAELLQGERRAG